MFLNIDLNLLFLDIKFINQTKRNDEIHFLHYLNSFFFSFLRR